MRAFVRNAGSAPRGASLITRAMADHGTINWPKCALCMKSVDAYGIENETPFSIEIWARCDGFRIDPQTGQAVTLGVRRHAEMKSSATIMKKPGYTNQRLTDIIRRLAFFDPQGDRQFNQTITPGGVEKRWGAG